MGIIGFYFKLKPADYTKLKRIVENGKAVTMSDFLRTKINEEYV